MRPNGESGDNVARAMSFARLSSDTGGGADDAVAVAADAGAGSNTAGDAWLTGFFFNVVFFSGMVMYEGWQGCHKAQRMGDRRENEGGKTV